jgi:hypothetical protein
MSGSRRMGVDKHPQFDRCPKCGSVADFSLHGDTLQCESCGGIVRKPSGPPVAVISSRWAWIRRHAA